MPVPSPKTPGPLSDPTYRRLFGAQVISLAGTGLTTIALSLLAYHLSGRHAGAVIGIALALKMIAYVVVAPVVTSYAQRLPRRRLLVGLDLARAAVVVMLPAVTAVWQVYVLIFVINAASAAFTPAFQAVIPIILPDEDSYTRALSLSRLAYELENLASPALAAMLLSVLSYNALFTGDAVSFLISAALVASCALPGRVDVASQARTWRRVTHGTRTFLRVAELRALLALNLAVAAASALIIVNTVIYVRRDFGHDQAAVAWALGAAGAGSMIAAIVIPSLLRRRREREVMLAGGALLPAGLLAAALLNRYETLLGVWFILGIGLAIVQTPAGRLVQRAAGPDDGPDLFAAQFSLSHACWLLTYPIAGVAGATLGLDAAAGLLAGVALAAVAATTWLWPSAATAASPEHAP